MGDAPNAVRLLSDTGRVGAGKDTRAGSLVGRAEIGLETTTSPQFRRPARLVTWRPTLDPRCSPR